MPWTRDDLVEKMKDIDLTLLITRTEGGDVASRPMSNNSDVDYDGDSWFFTTDDTRMVSDIAADPKVGLGFQGKAGLLGLKPFFLSLSGTASLIRDKAAFEAHWTKDLELWFKDGVDTPGLVLIQVHAERAHYWDGEDEGEIVLDAVAA